jgi:3-dehydrosphinganine reductase
MAGEFDHPSCDNEYRRMLEVNVLGSVFPTRACLPGMKAQAAQTGAGGRVVFVSSQVAQIAIHGYSAYGASKWALRGLAEALQMELKPLGIYVTVAYPPDTNTPGYEQEMLDKPELTKIISESGTVFEATDVAHSIVDSSSKGCFGASVGLDGWLLKQGHPGMTPVNDLWEVAQQVFFASLARFIGSFYLLYWDGLCRRHHASNQATAEKIAKKTKRA